MPAVISQFHDEMVNRFLLRGNCILLRSKDLLFPFLTKKGFAIKVNVQFSLNTYVYDDFLIDAVIT